MIFLQLPKKKKNQEMHDMLICNNNNLIFFCNECLALLVLTVMCPLQVTEILNTDVSLFAFKPF